MKKSMLSWSLVLFILTSCSEPKQEMPSDLLSPKVFTAVMIDVQIAEGMKTQKASGNRFASSGTGESYSFVFEKHAVSKDDFLKTYTWYRENPVAMEAIFETVLDSLSKLEAEIKQSFTDDQKEKYKQLPDTTDKTQSNIRAKLGS